MAPEVIKIMNFIRTASRKFPNVQFFFEEAADGFRKCLNIQKSKAKLSLDLTKIHNQKWELKVQVSGMFSLQPFLALKDKMANISGKILTLLMIKIGTIFLMRITHL